GADQRDEDAEGEPDRAVAGIPDRKRVDQELHAVLGRDRAADGGEHRRQDHAMRQRAPADIAEQKAKGAISVSAEIVHRLVVSLESRRRQTKTTRYRVDNTRVSLPIA